MFPQTRRLILLLFVVGVIAVSDGASRTHSAPVPFRESPATPPVLTVGDGMRTFQIKPTREGHRLCAWELPTIKTPHGDVGWHAGLEQGDCALKVNVIRPSVAFGGTRDTKVEWAAVLGLAEHQVKRVVLQFADGSTEDLALREWPGTPWLSYSYNFHGMPFPERVLAYGAGGEQLADAKVSDHIRPYCLIEEICARDSERDPGPWMLSWSAPDHQPDVLFTQADARRTYELVTDSALLKSILGDREYWVEDVGSWLTCDWRGRLGTWARVRLGRPAALEVDWPYVKLTKDGNSYTEHQAHRRVQRLESVFVMVDLERGRLVTVDPEDIAGEYPTLSDFRIVNSTTSWGVHWVGQTDCNFDY